MVGGSRWLHLRLLFSRDFYGGLRFEAERLRVGLSQMPGVLTPSGEGNLFGGVKGLVLWLFPPGRS